MSDYIPARDADSVNWSQNFAGLITTAPATYGLTAPDAVTIQTAADAYQAAYTTAVDPATRTPPNVAAKDVALQGMKTVCRPFAMQINANPAVTDYERANLAITIRDKIPSPPPPITAIPSAHLGKQVGSQLCLTVTDPGLPGSKKKPDGAQWISWQFMKEDAPGLGTYHYMFSQGSTKTPLYIDLGPGHSGTNWQFAVRYQGKGPSGLVHEGPRSPFTNFIAL
jgi:hypothetical protein